MNKTIGFSVSEEEYNKIKQEAEKTGCHSVSDYLRTVTGLKQKEVVADVQQI